ncbi:hypothetical protein AB4K20DRAFT_1989152 [Rhizopus microsporus]|uniref:Uncharacterized protein n=1 Tax=Rhizopus microsporus TaxID=58291 RepID=A0A1X0RXZ4_RHIZD|nr:hypothetical protein BCV71DRAFT_236235 [Rhizopus microsporus]
MFQFKTADGGSGVSRSVIKDIPTSSTIGAKNQSSVKSKHVPLPLTDFSSSSQRKRIIAFGNGSFGLSMKGKQVAPTRRITEEIKCKYKQSKGETRLFMLTSI